ncbi:hypothetical protein ACLK1Y_18000 [Escherichia coli]
MALKLLLATLLVTPLARYAKQPLLIRTRRLLGLWCFAWATIHLTSYSVLELGYSQSVAISAGNCDSPLSSAGICLLADFIGSGGNIDPGYAAKIRPTLACFTITSSILWRSSRRYISCGR